jgi:hypothetical protein
MQGVSWYVQLRKEKWIFGKIFNPPARAPAKTAGSEIPDARTENYPNEMHSNSKCSKRQGDSFHWQGLFSHAPSRLSRTAPFGLFCDYQRFHANEARARR